VGLVQFRRRQTFSPNNIASLRIIASFDKTLLGLLAPYSATITKIAHANRLPKTEGKAEVFIKLLKTAC
jgi:hypothetical protein